MSLPGWPHITPRVASTRRGWQSQTKQCHPRRVDATRWVMWTTQPTPLEYCLNQRFCSAPGNRSEVLKNFRIISEIWTPAGGLCKHRLSPGGHKHTHTYTHTHIHTYTRTEPQELEPHTNTHTHTRTHTHTHTRVHAYIRTYIHACIHTYVHTHVHTYMSVSHTEALDNNWLHIHCRLTYTANLQRNERTNERTNEQTNEQTNKQTNKQANKQTNTSTNYQPDPIDL